MPKKYKKRKTKPRGTYTESVKRPASVQIPRNKMTYKQRLALAIKEGKVNPDDLSDVSKYAVNEALRNEK
jgi:hypothetical protein|tara:strand:- start:1092 stop:1301 length:210 start_codon:yes stop_codon:yes gene_type:complete